MNLKLLPLLLILVLAACGRAVDEPFRPTQDVAPQPTATPLPTPLPDILLGDDPSARFETLIDLWGDPAQGEILFNENIDAVGFACATCHNHQNEERKIGPGLLNLAERSQERVSDQSAALYIFNSIANPDAYLVEDYDENLMPETYWGIFDTVELSHLTAYLLTLEGDPVVVDTSGEDGAAVSVSLAALPETADVANGEMLFTTYQVDAGFACSTCHLPDSENLLIGPGLLNVGTRASTRVEGQNNLEYIFTSITNPDAYVVDGFSDELMPENWAEIYTEDEIFDIMAYLLTLGDGDTMAESGDDTSDTNDNTDTDASDDSSDDTSDADTSDDDPSDDAGDDTDTSDTDGDANAGSDGTSDADADDDTDGSDDASDDADTTENDDGNDSADAAAPAELVAMLEAADANNGATLFTLFQPSVGFACSTCHLVDSDSRLIGPGLLDITTVAETRVEGMSGLEYIYQSLVAPNDYVVTDYPAELMPQWAEVYTEEELFDIIAYLLTLGE